MSGNGVVLYLVLQIHAHRCGPNRPGEMAKRGVEMVEENFQPVERLLRMLSHEGPDRSQIMADLDQFSENIRKRGRVHLRASLSLADSRSMISISPLDTTWGRCTSTSPNNRTG